MQTGWTVDHSRLPAVSVRHTVNIIHTWPELLMYRSVQLPEPSERMFSLESVRCAFHHARGETVSALCTCRGGSPFPLFQTATCVLNGGGSEL